MVSAKIMKEDRQKALSLGASDYIVKPIEHDSFIDIVTAWSGKKV